ncbi:MAG: hypothetical protein H6767_01930 [Candidatus Peribacteria bacterium]|nr:MAG: hypothetical protein H6767_01930 [Candidatus Peribacteria bacterium]
MIARLQDSPDSGGGEFVASTVTTSSPQGDMRGKTSLSFSISSGKEIS